MRNKLGYEYPILKVGQIYDIGDNILGKVTYAWKNGVTLFLMLNGPLEGREVTINGQSTSVYRLVKDAI